ncbi:hypothetical protein SAVCW2_67340 [Streptomyces avermitilis]|nr:hypothetical protein SAVCW2_67340 [Streptomyces avermitilis]
MRVEGTERPGHRVHRQIEAAERKEGQVGRCDRGDHAQGGFEPDVGGPAEAQHAHEGERTDAGGGGVALLMRLTLAGVLLVKHCLRAGARPVRSPAYPCALACAPSVTGMP